MRSKNSVQPRRALAWCQRRRVRAGQPVAADERHAAAAQPDRGSHGNPRNGYHGDQRSHRGATTTAATTTRNDHRGYGHDNGYRGDGTVAAPAPTTRGIAATACRPQYRSRQYVVDDWRGHHLSAPPRGYHWVQAGGDYVLAAIATGVIASILLNQ